MSQPAAALRESGDPTGDPVVLLHGLGSSGATWDGFAAALATAGLHVFAIDACGAGPGPAPTGHSVDALVGGLLAVLDAHGLDRVDLVGHSTVGGVARLFAGRHPRRVRRLVVEDAAPPPRTAPTGRPPAEPLGRITAPTLVVAGGSGGVRRQRWIQESAIPDVRVVEIDAGQPVHERAPAAFTQVVLEFLTLG